MVSCTKFDKKAAAVDAHKIQVKLLTLFMSAIFHSMALLQCLSRGKPQTKSLVLFPDFLIFSSNFSFPEKTQVYISHNAQAQAPVKVAKSITRFGSYLSQT